MISSIPICIDMLNDPFNTFPSLPCPQNCHFILIKLTRKLHQKTPPSAFAHDIYERNLSCVFVLVFHTLKLKSLLFKIFQVKRLECLFLGITFLCFSDPKSVISSTFPPVEISTVQSPIPTSPCHSKFK